MQNTNKNFGETLVCLVLVALCAFVAIAFAPVLIDLFNHVYDTSTFEVAEWSTQPHTLY